jgi:fructokinase
MSVICLGETLIDLLADRLGLSLAEVDSWTPYPGGAPTNVACGLLKLGTPTALIGCLGSDEVGDNLTQLLTEIGVDLTSLSPHPTAPTRQIYVTRSIDGDRTFAGFIHDIPTDRFADAFLTADRVAESLFTTAKLLAIGTISLAYPDSYQATYRALELADKYRLQVFVDVNWRSVFWDDLDRAKSEIYRVLERADFIKMSDEEAQWLYGTIEPQIVHQQLPNSQGIFITAGAKGCNYLLADRVGFVPSFDVPAIDTTGAGDSFVAACIDRLVRLGTEGIQTAEMATDLVRYASAAGALTTLAPGAIAAQPTQAEVMNFLATTGDRIN